MFTVAVSSKMTVKLTSTYSLSSQYMNSERARNLADAIIKAADYIEGRCGFRPINVE